MNSLRRALAWLLHGIVALQIEFPVQVLVSESANELASERVVALASRRQRELSRGCSENADTFQGDSALAGRSLAADGIAALLRAVQRSDGLLQLELRELVSLADVTAELASHLLHISLSQETRLASGRLLDAVPRRTIFITRGLCDCHYAIALRVRIRSSDLCQYCRRTREPLVLASPADAAERVTLPARL